jgi:uncharacterized protein (DUF924 family)
MPVLRAGSSRTSTIATMKTEPSDVLEFWFGSGPDYAPRDEWFRKDEAFDAQIRARFGTAIEAALAGGLLEWDATPTGRLARIVVLDQFTRNAFRGTPRAFAGDAQALAAAQALVDAGLDQGLHAVWRGFAYLPFEHAESLPMQDRSVQLFAALAEGSASQFGGYLDYAHRHRDVIRRFGRFPHRNAVLGRPSTPDELAYLAQPGSGF